MYVLVSVAVILIRHDIYPARGRKLKRLSRDRETEKLAAFATIFTPQGDGNTHHLAPPVCAWLLLQFATIFTPQGDGNIGGFTSSAFNFDIRHDIYPARGRKLLKRAVSKLNLIMSFATIFTPQGDGNLAPNGWGTSCKCRVIRHDIYPARGRKH